MEENQETRNILKHNIDSYTIKSTNKSVKPGDCVLMRPSDQTKPPHVARIEAIYASGGVTVRVRRYYRPEESLGRRREFHVSNEVFLSDHFDLQSADSIEEKCSVHNFMSYNRLHEIRNDDFFCRFVYNSTSGAFSP